MLTSTFAKKMREDQAFEKVVYGIICSNNLLKAHNFKDKLAKGAKELENEGWISPEEMGLILNAYTPPSADFSQ